VGVVPKLKSHMSVRMPPRLRQRLEATALASHRNLSEQVLYLLELGLRETEQPGLFDSTDLEPDDTVLRGATRLQTPES
jgi:hypothetical protein